MKQRDQTIDLLRGIVMILMVLDHTRDFFFGIQIKATHLEVTTPLLFFTRWITHFCAPAFVLLAGVSAYLYRAEKGSKSLSQFLLKRGIFLVLLELIVIRLGWVPDFGYHFTLLQVIWVLGWSMICLAGLNYLPLKILGLFGFIVIVGHNFLDPIQAADLGSLANFWKIFYTGGKIELFPGHQFLITYSLLPWLGVMLLGFAIGPIIQKPLEERRKYFLYLGGFFTALFVLFRILNQYGDPHPWAYQRSGLFTFMSFLNCEKYPPSFLYLMMTLGLFFVVFGIFDFLPRKKWEKPIILFGTVPLFFYILHLFLLRYSSLSLAIWRWKAAAFQFPPKGHGFSPEFPLSVVYLVWIFALFVLYPFCRWYSKIKEERGKGWLSYL